MALATAAFALLHSALATHPAKRVAGRLVGPTRRDACYRAAFVGQSLAAFAALTAYGAQLPARPLYRLSGPAAWLLRLGQAAGMVQMLAGLREIGFSRWSGLANLQAWRSGRAIPLGPIAQGPEMTADGRLTSGGPFRWSRHPLNFAGLPIIWLTPRLTTRRLAFNLVATLYLVIGSRHEEMRLADAYGAPYRAYAAGGVPFFWPLRRGRSRRHLPGGTAVRPPCHPA